MAAPRSAVRQRHGRIRTGASLLSLAGLFGCGVSPRAAAGPPDAALVTAWNEAAWDVAFREDSFTTFKGQRALALMHLAMHDALNTITPRYERWAYDGGPRRARPETAAAYAAYAVLVSKYPRERERLRALLVRSSDDRAHAAAVEIGEASAAAVLAKRTNDGWDAQGTYTYRQGAGQYQSTAGWNGFVVQPGFGEARPLALAAPHALRPAPPPPLASAAYARAFDEVKTSGAAASVVRTMEQTQYALWWMEYAEGSVNRLARRLAVERKLDAWQAARMFAHLNMALFDGYIATWDAKYAFNHWRPYTAIRAAATDGNAATEPDTAWDSLRPAPPFPEYTSAHATGCAASFAILASVFGDATPFTMTTLTAPAGMASRSFDRFSAAAAECADSRVRLGWHFRYATDAGLALGERVAARVHATQLRPR